MPSKTRRGLSRGAQVALLSPTFVSGACALVYENVWAKQLDRSEHLELERRVRAELQP